MIMNKMNKILAMALLPLTAIAGGGHHGHGDMHDDKNEMKSMMTESHGHDENAHKSGVGQAGDEAAITKTVQVSLLDTMRFEFSPKLSLEQGDVVKFVVTNNGKIKHEFSIGSESEQLEHRSMMRSMPNMTHQDANTVTVDPGQTMTLIWQFNGTEDPIFACNIPGHAEAGMVKRVKL